YHKGITYRDNCYHCNYAKVERVGDITIADYWGLGKVYSWDHSTENVSLIYGSTKKGLMAISDVVNAGFLEIYERPLQESVSTQGQLNKPTSITVRRNRFKAYYKKTHDFDLSIRKAMKMDIKFIGTPYYSKLILIRRLVRKIFKVDI
ncbi:Coenzyme F420 hydrogenase/dehydrogenase, beta subunit C-terminal domain, partial [Pseudobutyrivibrio sp.]